MKRKMSTYLKISREDKGAVLAVTIIVILALSILGLALLFVTKNNHISSYRNRNYTAAYYIAEAGINTILTDTREKVVAAGTDATDAVDFFTKLEGGSSNIIKQSTINDFQNSFGVAPSAVVNVTPTGTPSASEHYYSIVSTGNIGNQNRTVSTQITVKWGAKGGGTGSGGEGDYEWGAEDNLESQFVYSGEGGFSFAGNQVSGADATITINGDLSSGDVNGGAKISVTNLYTSGDAYLATGGAIIGIVPSGTNPLTSKIYIKGDLTLAGGVQLYGDVYVGGNVIASGGGGTVHGKLYVQGNADLGGGSDFHNDIYVGGNVKIASTDFVNDRNALIKVYAGGNLTLDWTPAGNFTVNYVGSLSKPNYYEQSILNKCHKVSSIPSIPTFTTPTYTVTLREDSWYTANGYDVENIDVNEKTIPANRKLVANNYTSSGWQNSVPGTAIIISKGDITISKKAAMNGVLIAPNGAVEFTQGGATFTGVVIADTVLFTGGGTNVISKKLTDYFTEENVPLTIGGGSGRAEGAIVDLTPIRED
ncbi:MAG: hypothetical protein GXY49_13455 [Syntrophomonadaceae bacterium]|nr:hypothetical protein [Syntrophomonadaceae bacterium]